MPRSGVAKARRETARRPRRDAEGRPRRDRSEFERHLQEAESYQEEVARYRERVSRRRVAGPAQRSAGRGSAERSAGRGFGERSADRGFAQHSAERRPVEGQVERADSFASRQAALAVLLDPELGDALVDDQLLDDQALVADPPPAPPGHRHTVTITGQGAEGYASRHGTRPSAAQRHRHLRPHERAGFQPDRVAMWAVFLGVLLVVMAVATAHA